MAKDTTPQQNKNLPRCKIKPPEAEKRRQLKEAKPQKM